MQHDRAEFLSRLVGNFILCLGQGYAIRSLIFDLVRQVEDELTASKVDRQPSDQVIKAKIVNTTVDVAHPQVYTILHGTDFDPNIELVYREGKLIDVKLIAS